MNLQTIEKSLEGANHTPTLADIEKRVLAGGRISEVDALFLLECKAPEELEIIRSLADGTRKKKVGDRVTFASTLHINPTNLCELNCPLCSYYAKPGWKTAWFLTPEECEKKIRSVDVSKLTEIHIVGGLWRDCNLDYYQELFGRIKSIDPSLHIKALTPVEYHFLAELHKIPIEEVFEKMISWGLSSLPGGGAEILVEKIRQKIAPGKISCDEFLSIHKLAHQIGLRSNITMLFNHIEQNSDIVTHLSKVRTLQDETGGFKTFVPLKFGEENNALGKRKKQLHKKNIPLVYAVSRLFLDNFDHLKILWNYLGIEEALELLKWGGNDFSSTNVEEKIIKMAGSKELIMDVETMTRLITEAGREPHLTNSSNC